MKSSTSHSSLHQAALTLSLSCLLLAQTSISCPHHGRKLRGVQDLQTSPRNDGPQQLDHEHSHEEAHDEHEHARSHRQAHNHSYDTALGFPEGFNQCGCQDPTEYDRELMAVAHAEFDKKHQGRSLAGTTIEIPVYFYVMQKTDGTGFLTDSQTIDLFMPAVTRGFANTPFTFVVKGLTRTVNDVWFSCNNPGEFKKALRQGNADALNIYVCDMVGGQNKGGDSFLPPLVMNPDAFHLDGIRIMHPALAGAEYQAYGAQSLVHEIGHWLGLLHTYDGGCDANVGYKYHQYPSYYFAGDGVSDTPAHAFPTSNYPQNSYCWRQDNLNTCRDDVQGVDPGPDPIDNFMNVLTHNCWSEYGRFTLGQITRMVAQYQTFRAPPAASTTTTSTTSTNTAPSCRSPGSRCANNGQCCSGRCRNVNGVKKCR